MSELSLSPNTSLSTSNAKEEKKTEPVSVSLLISDFYVFCSFVLSHPLYFSYFIFFSPYIFKILSFLSPLFVTTSLLLLILLTTFLHGKSKKNGDNVFGFSEDENGKEFPQFEQLEVYKIVFDTSNLEIGDDSVGVVEPAETKEIDIAIFEKIETEEEEAPVDKYSIHESFSCNSQVVKEKEEEEDEKKISEKENIDNDFVDVLCYEKEEKEVKLLREESNKVNEQGKEKEEEKISIRIGSNAVEGEKTSTDKDKVKNFIKIRANSCRRDYGDSFKKKTRDLQDPNYLGGFGSMRMEKEWKRTLACKLFEERHNSSNNSNNNMNVEGGEGMDMLWETYETELSKKVVKDKKGKQICAYDDEEEEEEETAYDDDDNAKLCCLQALKFSAGKMNLGMGRPNLVKISKAIKGIGWLHHLGGSKHAKKVHT